jgi:hypothetical protein
MESLDFPELLSSLRCLLCRWRCREPDSLVWPRDGEGERSGVEECLRLCLPRDVEVAACSFAGTAKVAPVFFFRSNSPQFETSTSTSGLSSLSTSTFAIRARASSPETIWPNTVCFLLRCGHGARVIKNLPVLVRSTAFHERNRGQPY